MRDILPATQQPMTRKTVLVFFAVLPHFLLLFITTYLLQYPMFHFDLELMRCVHQFSHPAYDQIAITLSYLGGMPAAIILMLLLIGHSVYTKSKNILFILISMIGATSISWLLKVVVDRPRPMLWPRLVQDYGASFPSGHSVYAAALACICILLFWRTKWRFSVLILAVMWMFFMGLSRVYLGVHYPSDVLAGWALGWGWVFLVYVTLSQRGKSDVAISTITD